PSGVIGAARSSGVVSWTDPAPARTGAAGGSAGVRDLGPNRDTGNAVRAKSRRPEHRGRAPPPRGTGRGPPPPPVPPHARSGRSTSGWADGAGARLRIRYPYLSSNRVPGATPGRYRPACQPPPRSTSRPPPSALAATREGVRTRPEADRAETPRVWPLPPAYRPGLD